MKYDERACKFNMDTGCVEEGYSLGYADLILNSTPEEYLKNVAGSHGLED